MNNNSLIYNKNFINKIEKLYKNDKFNDENITNFLEEYDKIVKKDYNTPLFSKTKTYNNFPPNHNFKKINKNFKVLTRGHNAWEPCNKELIESKEIIKLLNKINNSNYLILKDEFHNKIKKTDYKTICDVIDIIYKKCITDIDYQELYIDINNELLNNCDDFVYYVIKEKFNKNKSLKNKPKNRFYWELINTNKKGKYFYENEDLAKKDLKKLYSYYKIFINKFLSEFTESKIKLDYANEKNDKDLLNKIKKDMINVSKFLLKCYAKKIINTSTIYQLISFLITSEKKHCQQELEVLFTIISYLNENNFLKNFNLNELKNNYKIYVEIINGMRLKFILDDLEKIINSTEINSDDEYEKVDSLNYDINLEQTLKNYFEKDNKLLIPSIYNCFFKDNLSFIDSFIFILENEYYLLKCNHLFNDIKNFENEKDNNTSFFNIFHKLLNELDIEDLKLDLPNIENIIFKLNSFLNI